MGKRVFFGVVILFSVILNHELFAQQLVANYGMNGDFNDVSGNEYHGVVSGTIEPTEDRWGNENLAMDFTGPSNFVDINFNGLQFNNELTISFWAKVSNSEVEYARFIAVNQDTGTPEEMALRLNYISSENDYRFKIGDAENTQIQSYSREESWELVTATYDNFEMRLYVNGELRKSITTAIELDSFTSLRIGDAYSASRNYNGALDDLRIYNYALSESEINTLYTSGGWEGISTIDDPVAFYPFDGNANDDSGNGNNGIVIGAQLSNDRFGLSNSAYQFDGVDDYINTGDFISIDNSFSYSGWYKLQSSVAGIHHAFFTKDTYCDFAVMYYSGNEQISSNIRTFNGTCEGLRDNDLEITLPAESWFHFAFTYDGSMVKIYIDGEVVNEFDYSSTIVDTQDLLIGATFNNTGTAYFWDGFIDDVRVYDRPLSSSDIYSLYSEGGWQGSPLIDNPVAHYTFEGDVVDITGNGNDGENNGATFITDRFGNENGAIHFDGIDDYVAIQHSSQISPTEAMSISSFIKIDDFTQIQRSILSKKAGGGYNLAINRPEGEFFGQYAFNGGDTEVNFPMSMLNQSEWFHVAMTYDKNQVSIYLNGELVDSDTQTLDIRTNSVCLFLGAEASSGCTPEPGQFSNVALDDLRLFDRALTESEIIDLSNEGEDDIVIDGALAFGPLNFTADDIIEIGDNTYQLTGNIILSEILEFDGSLTVNTATYTVEGNGAVFLSNIPELETVYLYEGNIYFTLTDGESSVIEANTLLGAYSDFEVAGFTVGLETIEILNDGVKIEGLLELPEIFKVNASFETLQITKSEGLDLIGEIEVKDVKIAGGATLKQFKLSYDTIQKIIDGEAELDTKLIDIAANARLIDGKLDRIGVVISSNKNIPIGNTGLGLAGGGGEIGGLQDKSNRYVQVETVIVPILPGVEDIIQLNDLTFRYDFGRSFSAYGNLIIFNRELSDAELIAKKNNISFSGGVNFSDILIGTTGLGLTKSDESLLLNGNLDGILQIPSGDGFPFGIIEVILGELPYEVGSTTNSFDNYGIRGSTDIQNLNMDYALEWVDGDLDASFAVNMSLLNLNLFAKTRLEELHSKATTGNPFEGRSLIVNPEDPFYSNKRSFAGVLETFTLDNAYPTLIIRLEGSTAPDYSIINPIGNTINPENVDDFQNIDFYKNENVNRSYYLIKSPATGDWSVEIPDDQQYELDVLGSGTPPSIQFDVDEFKGKKSKSFQSSSSLNIVWSANDPDSDALISFYYDEDNQDYNGTLIEGGIEENQGNGAVFWDTSTLSTGDYYLYAKIEDGDVSPRYTYLDKKVFISLENAPNPPLNLSVSVQDSAVAFFWDELDQDNSYLIYFSDNENVGYNSNYISANDSSVVVDSLLNSGRPYFIAISAVDTNGVEGRLSEIMSFDFISASRNNVPYIQSFNGVNQVKVEEEYSASLFAIDNDEDILSYSLTGEPENMTIDNSGIINWLPNINQVGRFNFKALVTDGLATDSISLSVIVVDSISSTGSLSFLSTSLSDVNIPYGLTLRDINLNTSDAIIDSALITLTAKNFETGFNVFLYETSSNSGVFEGTIELTDEVTNIIEGLISVNDIDTLLAVYIDEYPQGERIAKAFISPTLVSNEDRELENFIPQSFELEQNYPNPFNPVTQISYSLPKSVYVKLEVRNVLGQLVSTLISEVMPAGKHAASFDATRLSSGVYFYTIDAGDFKQTKKMLLIK